MDHETDPRPEPTAETDRPANWDADEMKADFGEGSKETRTDDTPDAPGWNEDQMARERPDGTRSQGPSDAEIASSKGGLSGGGANPGGGERWADRDADDKAK